MNNEMNYEDWQELERLYNSRLLSKHEAVESIKSYLDRELAGLREYKATLELPPLGDPGRDAVRQQIGQALNDMVLCDYEKRLAWAQSDHTELEKKLRHDLFGLKEESISHILSHIKKKANTVSQYNGLYAARLLLHFLEEQPNEYTIGENFIKRIEKN
jgi:hypothetical protein